METNKVTELVLENVENLLLEGRVENIKKRYPQPMWKAIDDLVEADPSKTNKFLEWAAKYYLPKTIKWFKENTSSGYYGWDASEVPDTPEDERWDSVWSLRRSMMSLNKNKIGEIKDNLEHFFRNPSKYEIKDINQFKSTEEFEDAVEIAKQKLSRKEMKETGVDKVFEDERFILLMPKTHKAACRYGARTQWCVTMRGYSGYYENYFGQGPIFFLIDKSQPERQFSPKYMYDAPDYWKLAIHYRPFNGRLDQRGNRAFSYATDMSREEFIDGGNIGNTWIDYWNVRDENKSESMVSKFLGGAGRGQSERALAILNPLKNVMEKYTKRVLADYYDSFANVRKSFNKLKKLKEKSASLNNLNNNEYQKISRLNDIQTRLNYFETRLETDESDDEYRSWVSEQIETTNRYLDIIKEQRDKTRSELNKINEKIEDLESEVDKKKLVFYDIEKNVPMTR